MRGILSDLPCTRCRTLSVHHSPPTSAGCRHAGSGNSHLGRSEQDQGALRRVPTSAEAQGRFSVQHVIPSPAGLAPATATPDHAIVRSATWWRPVPGDGHRAIGQPADGGAADAPAKGYQRPWAGLGKAQLVDQLPDQPQPTPAKARQGSRVWGGRAAPVADGRLDPAATDPDGHRDRLRVAGPVQDGVGGGLADGQDQVVDHLVRDGSWHLRQAVSDGTPQLGKAARRAGKRDLHVLPPAGVAAPARGRTLWCGHGPPDPAPPTSGQRGWRAGSGSAWQAEATTAGASSATVRCPEVRVEATKPYACASTGGWLARSRACCAWLDASRSSARRPRRSCSWRRVALSRSSWATLPCRSRCAARSWRRLARRAPEERQASPSSSAPSRPSPAATTSSWPWVKPVIDWSKTETELALVLARTASPSSTASATASTRNNAAMLPPVALEWLSGLSRPRSCSREPSQAAWLSRTSWRPNRGKRSGPSVPGWIGHVRRRAWWLLARACRADRRLDGRAGGLGTTCVVRTGQCCVPQQRCTKGRRRY